MFKIYQKYLIISFLKTFFYISLIFSFLICIMNVLEELNFLKDSNIDYYYPYFLTLLNLPITLFEIFPFIFLISTQYFFYDIYKKNELLILKNNGLNNLSIIKTLFIVSFVLGFFMIILYYNKPTKN